MTAPMPIELVSVADYLVREQASQVKHEYLGGRIYAMAGARTVHDRIASACHGSLYAQLRGKRCEAFTSNTKVRLRFPTHTRFYYPDGMVVCEPNPADDTFQDRPVVIAEVISDVTRRIDEGEKREAYLSIPTLTFYLLIEPDRPRVAVHRRTDDGFVAELYEGLGAVIALEPVGARLALADLYERVEFAPETRQP